MRRVAATMVLLCSACSEDPDAEPELGEAQQATICGFATPPSVDHTGGGIGGSAQYETVYGYPVTYGYGECDFFTAEWNDVDLATVDGPDFDEDQCEQTWVSARFFVKSTSWSSWQLAYSTRVRGVHDGVKCTYPNGGYYGDDVGYSPGYTAYRMRISGHVEGYDSSDPNQDLENRRVQLTGVRDWL